jgi:membrane-bound serine protease (ClpP class)
MAGAVSVDVRPTRSEAVLGRMNQISLLLLVAGLLLAFLETKVPGFGIPGILSIACFTLLFTARYLVGLADIPHIVLAVVGLTMVAVELFLVPGTIWVGLVGFVLFLSGVVFGQLGADFRFAHALDQAALMQVARELVLAMVAALLGAWALSRWLPATPAFSRLVLEPDGPAEAGEALPEARRRGARLGDLGRAVSALRPVGKIVLDRNGASEYEARAAGRALEHGDRVRVVEVTSGRLVVEAIGGASGGAPEEAPGETPEKADGTPRAHPS